ncbi:hypothetical protein EDC96DRAFT_501824 [Choanephora cucurbitarum]|nr:hypothetical protein EDC96DRAFT_501824 [Choanephora cucurbitarum]
MSGPNNLPQEIHFQILNHLDAYSKSHYVSVCKNWSKPAKWELYRTVKLSDVDQLNKLIATLSSNPCLGELVISLTLKFHIPTQDMLQTLIQCTPHMEIFHVKQGMTSIMYDTIAKVGHHWTSLHALDSPDWRRKHDNYYKALLSLSSSLTKIDIIVPSEEVLYAPGPNYLAFLSLRESKFSKVKELVCHTSYPSRKRSTELRTLDHALSQFMGLESVELQLFELEDDQAYLAKVQPNLGVKQLKVDVNHMTDILLYYLLKKFPSVNCFEFWHQSSYDCKPFYLSANWIQLMTRYLQLMDRYTIILRDASNQMELVSRLESQLATGTSDIKLHYNNDPRWYSNYEASIWFERGHILANQLKEISIDPSLLSSETFMYTISDYLKMANHLCLYNKAKERLDISYGLNEIISRCSRLNSLTITRCTLFESSMLHVSPSLTTLNLVKCSISTEAFEYLSRTFQGLTNVHIQHVSIESRFQWIHMPYTSADIFSLEFDPLPSQTSIVLQVVTLDTTCYYELKNQYLESISMDVYESQVKSKEVIQFKIVLKSVVQVSIRCLTFCS